MSKKSVNICMKWIHCNTDPTSYKQYSPEFEPEDCYIEVTVPNNYVVRQEKKKIILSPRGMALRMP